MVHILQEEVALSVIICNHVKGVLLDRCLDSVRKSQQVKYEVIVVSSIPAIELGEDVMVIHSVEGPAYKRNLASRFARGKYPAQFPESNQLARLRLLHGLFEL